MITLYTFGQYFGLPDPSPFVMKAEMLLKISGLPYQTNSKGFPKAPEGQTTVHRGWRRHHRGLHAHPPAPGAETRHRFRPRTLRA